MPGCPKGHDLLDQVPADRQFVIPAPPAGRPHRHLSEAAANGRAGSPGCETRGPVRRAMRPRAAAFGFASKMSMKDQRPRGRIGMDVFFSLPM